jgi:hypothetical protein
VQVLPRDAPRAPLHGGRCRVDPLVE